MTGISTSEELAREAASEIDRIMKEKDFDFAAITEKVREGEIVLDEMPDELKAVWTFFHRKCLECEALMKDIRQFGPFAKSELIPKVAELKIVYSGIQDMFWWDMGELFRVEEDESIAIREGFQVVKRKKTPEELSCEGEADIIVVIGIGVPDDLRN